MERIGPAEILQARISILTRANTQLQQENRRLTKKANHWKDKACWYRRSRDMWKRRATSRSREVWATRWQLDPEHPRHPMRKAAA